MYSKEKKLSKYEDIERYIKKLGWENKSDRKIIKIIYFESEIPISENECKIHVTNNFTNCIELGKIYFNNNSINFLEEQLLKNSMSYKFKDCRSIINKNILCYNFSLFDINKFIIYSGSILYSYGIRSCTDIDMFVSDKPKQIFTKDYYEKIKDFFISDKRNYQVMFFTLY